MENDERKPQQQDSLALEEKKQSFKNAQSTYIKMTRNCKPQVAWQLSKDRIESPNQVTPLTFLNVELGVLNIVCFQRV